MPIDERSSMSEDDDDDPEQGVLGFDERLYLHIYDYETKEFSGLTTYHGLVRIYNSNTWASRIFWCCVVLCCLSLFMIHSGYLLLSYHAKPTLFQIVTRVPDNGMLFPDITICPQNPVAPHRLKGWNISDALAAYILNSYWEQSRYSDEQLQKLENDLNLYKHSYVNLTSKAFHIPSFLHDISPKCEDIVQSCSLAGISIDHCCQYATLVHTDAGYCIRFEQEVLEKRQHFSGFNYGFNVVIDSKNHWKPDWLPPLFSDLGIRVLVNEKGKEKSMRSQGISAPPGVTLYTSLDTNNITLLQRNDWGHCQMDWDQQIHGSILFNATYTSNHCEWNCQAQQYIKSCDCLPLSLHFHSNYSICSLKQLHECGQRVKVNQKSCYCDKECSLVDYPMHTSYGLLSRRSMAILEDVSQEYVSNSVTSIWIYFRSISIDVHEQQKQLQTADLLSNIAGSMGLFLGMSTVTLLEIFIYLFKSVYGTVNTERQQQFLKGMLEEEEERRQSLVIIEEPIEQKDQSQEDNNTTGGDRRMSRKFSILPARRKSRIVIRRDSSAVPDTLLPSISARKSISITNRRGSQMDTFSETVPSNRRRASMAANRFLQPNMGPRLSVQHADDAFHLSIISPPRRSSINPKNNFLI